MERVYVAGWAILQVRGQIEREIQDALGWTFCAGLLDSSALRVGLL